MEKTAFFLLRLSMGVNLFFHAVNRFYNGTDNFSNWMLEAFEPTFLPTFGTSLFALVLPYLEATIGLSLLLGFKTRWSLIAGSLLMGLLIMGSCLISQWDWAAFQMIYMICFYLLLLHVNRDHYSLDNYLRNAKNRNSSITTKRQAPATSH